MFPALRSVVFNKFKVQKRCMSSLKGDMGCIIADELKPIIIAA